MSKVSYKENQNSVTKLMIKIVILISYVGSWPEERLVSINKSKSNQINVNYIKFRVNFIY